MQVELLSEFELYKILLKDFRENSKLLTESVLFSHIIDTEIQIRKIFKANQFLKIFFYIAYFI